MLHAYSRAPLVVATVILLFLSSLLSVASADHTGTISHTTFNCPTAFIAGGQFVEPGNAFSSNCANDDDTNDDIYAKAIGNNQKEEYTTFNIVVPTGYTIDGIEVKLEGKKSSNQPQSADAKFKVKLSGNNGITFTDEKNSGELLTTDKEHILGGSTDTWGRTWSSSEFSNTNFRLFVRSIGVGPAPQHVLLDFVQVRVFFSLPSPTGLTATAISSQIDLSWTDNSATESEFHIERCTGAGCSDFDEIATVTAGTTTFSNSGLASGTTFTYRVRAHDDTTGIFSTFSNTATTSTITLLNGVVGQSFSQTLLTTGGTGPFSWSILPGTLPSGLSLNIATGVISGTPTTSGTTTFTVQVTDNSSNTASQTLSITVNPPTFSGIKFVDTNNDGLDTGEPGVPGAEIRLRLAGSTDIIDTDFTDSTGLYSFPATQGVVLSAGTYVICGKLQTGFIQSLPKTGPSCPGSDEGPFGYQITIVAGQTVTSLDFGNAIQPTPIQQVVDGQTVFVAQTPVIDIIPNTAVKISIPPTPTTASVTEINIPSNSACPGASLNISQRPLLPGESPPPNIFIGIVEVIVNNCSGFTTEAGLNGAITIFVLIKKNLDVDKLPDGCPDAEFRIFNTNTGVYDPLTLTRHPATDVEGDPSTDADDLCEYIGEAPHFSKFSVGGIKKATGGGGGRDVDWTTVDRTEPSIVEYYWKPDVPSAGQNVTVNAHLLDDVGVDKATLYYITPTDGYSKAYSISMSKLNIEWFTADVPGADVGTPNIGFWITVIDFGGNMAKSDTKEVKVQQGTPVSIKASVNNLPAHVLETIKPRFTQSIEKLEIISMNGGKEIKSYPDKIIIRNAGNIAVNNIRIMLSPEISNSFKLSDKAIKSIEPNGNVTINMELNGNPNRDMFGGLTGYKGEVMVMAEHHNPITLPVKIGAQESNYMSDYLDKVASMAKRFNRLSLLSNLLPHASAEHKDFDLTTSSGDREITSASDSLTINNTSDKQIKNVRIIVSKLGNMFLLDKSNIKTLAPNESVTIKLIPKIDSTKYSPKDFTGEIIVIGDNGLPNVIPVRIIGEKQKDSKDEFEVRTLSENNTITEAVDSITIKNKGNRTMDSVKLIISAGLDRTLGLSENSFRTIEPNSGVTVDLRFKAAIGEKKEEFMQNYVGELTVVSEHHNLSKVSISIEWNKIEGKHFTVYARNGNEPVAKQVIDVLENNYQNITSRFGEMKTKTVIYMAGSEEEMRVVNPSIHPYYSYTDDTIFICACGDDAADAKHNAIKEFIYRLVINNYASYHNMKKFIFDQENWLLDGVTSYMASNIVSTTITNESHAAFTSDTSFQWYGYGSAEQYGATYSFFEYLESKYGSKVIDKTLYYLGAGMTSNHRCDTIENCALLQAVYNVNGLDINKKRYALDFDTLIKEWEVYKNN